MQSISIIAPICLSRLEWIITYTERLRSSLIALISIFLRPMFTSVHPACDGSHDVPSQQQIGLTGKRFVWRLSLTGTASLSADQTKKGKVKND